MVIKYFGDWIMILWIYKSKRFCLKETWNFCINPIFVIDKAKNKSKYDDDDVLTADEDDSDDDKEKKSQCFSLIISSSASSSV